MKIVILFRFNPDRTLTNTYRLVFTVPEKKNTLPESPVIEIAGTDALGETAWRPSAVGVYDRVLAMALDRVLAMALAPATSAGDAPVSESGNCRVIDIGTVYA